MQAIIFAGPPGCGKGTQACLLKKAWPEIHLIPPMSALLEERARQEDELGRSISQTMKSHGLVDDLITTQIFFSAVGKLSHDAVYLSDGFPRTMIQYIHFKKFARNNSYDRITLLHFSLHIQAIPEEQADQELVSRMIRRIERPITKEECYRRIDVFKERTLPFLFQVERESRGLEYNWIKYIQIGAWKDPHCVHQDVRENMTSKLQLNS